MKTTLKIMYLLVVAIAFSCCATWPKTVVTVALDKNQSDTILKETLPMQKGKVCFVYTTSYGDELPMGFDLKKKLYADFTSQNPGKGLWGGGTFFSGEADTTVTSTQLIQLAVYEVIRKLPQGMEFAILDKDEFTDNDGNFQKSQLIEKYQPDILITLTDLVFYVNGDVDASGITQTHFEGNDTYMTGTDMRYTGNIYINYQAQWDITWVKEGNRQIEQKGQTRSVYGKTYDLPKELFSCAKQTGNDFASLLVCKK